MHRLQFKSFVYTTKRTVTAGPHCIYSSSSTTYTLHRHQHRNFLNLNVKKRFTNWMKSSDKNSNVKAWVGEARRFLEYEEYTLYSFDAHLRTTVDSFDRAGYGRRGLRWFMKILNKDADAHQKKMIDESRQLLQVLDTFPRQGFEDPDKYFKGLNKSKLAMETKLQTSDINSILDKYQNQKTTHKLLKERVLTGRDLPRSAEEMQEELSKPHNIVQTMKKNQKFGASNPNKVNEVYDKYIEEWNHKIWISPYRLRQDYHWQKNWKRMDWRQYQSKWKSLNDLEIDNEKDVRNNNNKEIIKKKLYPEDYTRKEKLAAVKPSWMKKLSWRQNYEKLLTEKNKGYNNGIEKYVDIYNYDRFRSIYDKTDMKDRITKPPRWGTNWRGYHH